MKLYAAGDRIIVRPDPVTEEKTGAGIIKVDLTREKPQRGTVVNVGPDCELGYSAQLKGANAPMDLTVEPGDRVLYGRYSGVEIEEPVKLTPKQVKDGKPATESLIVLRPGDILGVYNG